jgi:uncharacterized protein DUF6916
MSVSRRFFIKTASVAAIAAGITAKPTLAAIAQDFSKASPDPLSYYTQSTFTQYLNSIFRLRGRITVEVALIKVEDTLPAKVTRGGGRESFVLHFRGGANALPQDTYTVEHAALGTFKLFLVPAGADENGAQGYTATVNRLSFNGKVVGPTRVTSRKAPERPNTETSSPEPALGTPATKSVEPTAPKSKPRQRQTTPDQPDLDR